MLVHLPARTWSQHVITTTLSHFDKFRNFTNVIDSDPETRQLRINAKSLAHRKCPFDTLRKCPPVAGWLIYRRPNSGVRAVSRERWAARVERADYFSDRVASTFVATLPE